MQRSLVLCAESGRGCDLLCLHVSVPVQLDARADRAAIALRPLELELDPVTLGRDSVLVDQQRTTLVGHDDVEHAGVAKVGQGDGTAIIRIVRTDRVELEVQVPAADVATARQTADLALELPGSPTPIALDPHHVHDSGVIDATTRALGLQMEVVNPGESLLVGQVGTAILYGRTRERLPSVPEAAVLMEAGRPYVFVQEGGEKFSRRFVEVASREGGLVGIKSGVKPGDRVVTKGSYDVQLASAAKGLPAEGHVH